ncbi:YciI family protein [Variovorax paradoxus]|uniref:YCII-related protein n=1 Tax=Variovorax paradoxus (strain EPS) TaxID=595537 RepID=E6V2G8_VARPE|nr:YciI family protein [Variovorax paradoxus]ADU35689.1 YCII-related protein [Variovorax paradoxus EPS]
MPFAIIALDKPHAEALRAALKPAHLDYLTARQHMMLAGGALLDADGQPIGGLIVVDTDDLQTAQAFAREDPFNSGQLFASVEVMPWRQAFFDRKRTR